NRNPFASTNRWRTARLGSPASGIDDHPELGHRPPVGDGSGVRALDVQLGREIERHLLGTLRLDDPLVLGTDRLGQPASLLLLVGRQGIVPRDQQEPGALLRAGRTDREVERLDLVALVAALLEVDREGQLHGVLAPMAGWVNRVRSFVPTELERIAVPRDVE